MRTILTYQHVTYTLKGRDLMATKLTRRKRATTRAMPDVLTARDVSDVMRWPLGSVKTNVAAGELWTDCIVQIVDAIRLGGKYNTRRVRYDGRFYIMHLGRRVELWGAVAFEVADCASHVYGVCKDEDKAHNRELKGY